MGLQRREVEKVAKLSRLTLAPGEVELFADQLSRIVDHVGKLNELQTDDVAPLSHALAVANVFRDDQPRDSLPVETVLANAPDRTAAGFKVPRVLEGDEE
jgi:aspartyl-tRNA(Asn)/glutamyl-tRNA(Gln) amidotransferase subunit C